MNTSRVLNDNYAVKEETCILKKNFLSVNNGSEIEYNYFCPLKSKIIKIKEIKENQNLNAFCSVEKTIDIMQRMERKLSLKYGSNFKFDEVWAIFDDENVNDNDIKDAYELAKRANIAFSLSARSIKQLFSKNNLESCASMNTIY
ncbi:MAG: RloB family protein [Peptostreptococcaceae bacterium]|jgi:hypothetical protein|nr:RloB family protein [Peptostreptococcaceae bacterium]